MFIFLRNRPHTAFLKQAFIYVLHAISIRNPTLVIHSEYGRVWWKVFREAKEGL